MMWDALAQAARGDTLTATTRVGPTAAGPAVKAATTSGRHRVPMPVSVDAKRLTIDPDQSLLTDPATVFPVYIDPGLTVNRAGYAVVNSASPTTSFWNIPDDAYVGSWDSGTSKYRTFFSYDLTGSPVAGTYISAAQLDLYETYSASCTASQFEVWSTDVPTSTTTWNSQPAWYAQQSTSTATKGFSSSCPAGSVPMNVTSYLQSAADNAWNGVGFGVRATSETDPNGWKRFSNNPTLTITYTAYPTTSALDTAPSTSCVTGTNRPYLNTVTPLLQARISDPEGALVRPEFSWSTTGGTPVGSAQPTPGQASGQTFATTIPTTQLTNGSSYSWKVRGFDSTT